MLCHFIVLIKSRDEIEIGVPNLIIYFFVFKIKIYMRVHFRFSIEIKFKFLNIYHEFNIKITHIFSMLNNK